MYRKDAMIQDIDRKLNSMDPGTVGILYRIICGDKRKRSWRGSTERKSKVRSEERTCKD